MSNARSSELAELKGLLNDLFPKSLAQSISSMTGEEVEATPGQPFEPGPSALWFHWNLKPAEYGSAWFGGPKKEWFDLGKAILYGGGEDGESDDELIVSTVTEIASQVAGSITTFLNHQYQRQIETGSIEVQSEVSKLTAGAHTSFHKIHFVDGRVIPVCFGAAESLFESLIPVKKQEEAVPALSVDAKKLELLLDVEMPVSISIGRAQMPLKEVVRLTTGSIVELSRNVSEPVDIVVNNCVVAKGDVVVVEGNFGVRIREVLSREDRVRHLLAS